MRANAEVKIFPVEAVREPPLRIFSRFGFDGVVRRYFTVQVFSNWISVNPPFEASGVFPCRLRFSIIPPYHPTPSDRARKGFAPPGIPSPPAPSIPAAFRAVRSAGFFPPGIVSPYRESDSFLPCCFFRKNAPWRGRGRSRMRRAKTSGSRRLFHFFIL